MSINATDYHETPDPDLKYEPLLINPGYGTDAINCCVCIGGQVSWCGSEDYMGAFMTSFSAQSFAYWSSY